MSDLTFDLCVSTLASPAASDKSTALLYVPPQAPQTAPEKAKTTIRPKVFLLSKLGPCTLVWDAYEIYDIKSSMLSVAVVVPLCTCTPLLPSLLLLSHPSCHPLGTTFPSLHRLSPTTVITTLATPYLQWATTQVHPSGHDSAPTLSASWVTSCRPLGHHLCCLQQSGLAIPLAPPFQRLTHHLSPAFGPPGSVSLHCHHFGPHYSTTFTSPWRCLSCAMATQMPKHLSLSLHPPLTLLLSHPGLSFQYAFAPPLSPPWSPSGRHPVTTLCISWSPLWTPLLRHLYPSMAVSFPCHCHNFAPRLVLSWVQSWPKMLKPPFPSLSYAMVCFWSKRMRLIFLKELALFSCSCDLWNTC
jgi:hypothetical protein